MDPDEDLPWPDPALVADWWGRNKANFPAGQRLICGQPVSREACMRVLQRVFNVSGGRPPGTGVVEPKGASVQYLGYRQAAGESVGITGMEETFRWYYLIPALFATLAGLFAYLSWNRGGRATTGHPGLEKFSADCSHFRHSQPVSADLSLTGCFSYTVQSGKEDRLWPRAVCSL